MLGSPGPPGPGPGGTLPTDVVAAADLLELANYDGQVARGQRDGQRSSVRSDASAGTSYAPVEASDEDAINLLTHWDKARLQEEQRRARRSQAGLPKMSEPGQLQGEYHRGSNERLATVDISHPATSARELTYGLLAQPFKGGRKKEGPGDAAAAFKESVQKPGRMELGASSSSLLHRNNSGDLSGLSTSAPQGLRKQRRNSYSVGYGASPLGQPMVPDFAPVEMQRLASVEPSVVRTASGRNGPTRRSTVTDLKNKYAPAPVFVPGDERRSAATGTVQAPSSFNPATSAQAGQSDESEPKGIGSKLRRIISRTRSRAHLKQAPTSSSMLQPVAMESDEDDEEEGLRGGREQHPANGEALPGAMLQATRSSTHVDDDETEEGGTGDNTGLRPRPSGGDQATSMAGRPSVSLKRGGNKGANNYVRPLSTLPPFVSRLLKEDISLNDAKYKLFDQTASRELTAASKTLEASMTEFQGAVMIADVKGFTQLTEILSKKGTAGVELLTNCMNNYFTRVINMILAFDGDVVKFAGDSMIVAFKPNEQEEQEPDQGLHAATLRCTQCAHVLATRLGHMRMKMNGQVEPINVQVPDRVQEGDEGHTESDLLRRNSVGIGGAGPSNGGPGGRRRVTSVNTTTAGAPQPASTSNIITSSSLAADMGAGFGRPPAAGPAGRASVNLPTAPVLQHLQSTGVLVPHDEAAASDAAAAGPATTPAAGSLSLTQVESGLLEAGPGTSGGAGTPASQQSSSFTRKKDKSWIRNVMRKPSQMARATGSVTQIGATGRGAGDLGQGAGGTSSTQSHQSPSGRSSKRQRARTEAGISGASAASARPSISDAAALWGTEAGGFAKRELSLASKLNIPPPVRVLNNKGVSSLASSTTGDVLSAQAAQPGSFTAEGAAGAVLLNQSPSRRMGGVSGGSSLGLSGLGNESWAAKFQNLQSNVMGGHEDLHIERSRLSFNARQAMQNWEPLNEEELQVGGGSAPGGTLVEAQDAEGLSIGAVAASSASRGRMTDMRKRIFGRKGSSAGIDTLAAAGSTSEGGAAGQQRTSTGGPVSTSVTNTSTSETAQGTTLPLTAVLQAEAGSRQGSVPYEWSEDSYAVDAVSSSFTAGKQPEGGIAPLATASSTGGPIARRPRRPSATNASIGGYGAPVGGPIAEGLEDESTQLTEAAAARRAAGAHATTSAPDAVSSHQAQQLAIVPWRSRAGPVAEGSMGRRPTGQGDNSSVHGGGMGGMDGGGGGDPYAAGGPHPRSFMSKVVSWFGGNPRGQRINDDIMATRYRGGGGGDEGPGDNDSQGSMSAHSNSFGYPTGLLGRLQPTSQFGKTRDPVMEEVQNSTFSLKIMVSAGSVSVFHVGGNIDEVTDPTMPEVPRWEYFIGDRPLAPRVDQYQRRRCIMQLAAIERHAEAGEVVGSLEVVELIRDEWEIEMLQDDIPVGKLLGPQRPFVTPIRGTPPAYRNPAKVGGAVPAADERPTDLTATVSGIMPLPVSAAVAMEGAEGEPGVAAVVPVGPVAADADPAVARHEFSLMSESVQRRCAGLLRMHVLGSVRSRIEAGHLDFINEIRPLTCIFLGFPSLLAERDTATHSDQVACVQFAVAQVQEVMRKWDGSFMQFRCDEKGFVAICAFGLPGHTHEDNPSRGILAALELSKRIKEGSHRVCIGVTTGDLLCTCVGARKIRSEYTVFGDAINLSARLMVKCQKGGMGDILCDEPTHTHAKYKANYEELEPIPVKGKKMPVVVYRVTPYEDTGAGGEPSTSKRPGADGGADGRHGNNAPPERPLMGRDTEMSFILNRAANMIAGMATGGAIVIEGNTGMGKTKLLTEVRKSLERINADTSTAGKPAFHLFFGVADIANKSQKLHPWRRIFQDLFATDMHRGMRGGSTLPMPKPSRAKKASLDGEDPTSAVNGPSAITLMGDRLASRIPSFNVEWRKHLSELLDIPAQYIPRGMRAGEDEFVSPGSGGGMLLEGPISLNPPGSTHPWDVEGGMVGPGSGSMAMAGPSGGGTLQSMAAGVRSLTRRSTSEAEVALAQSSSGVMQDVGRPGSDRLPPPDTAGSLPNRPGSSKVERAIAGAMNALGGRSMMRSTPATQISTAQMSDLGDMIANPLASSALGSLGGDRPSLERTLGGTSMRLPAASGQLGGLRNPSLNRSASNTHGTGSVLGALGGPAAAGAKSAMPTAIAPTPPGLIAGGTNTASPQKKNSLNFLVHIVREFTALYGPIIILLENLHEFDTWSWQLLVKVAEVLSPSVLILATTRPNEPPAVTSSHHLHGKAALYQKVAMMYRHLLKLPTTSRVHLEPFTFQQTKALMQVVADINYPDQYVLAVMEKTGGMPLYIEKVTEFLCQKPWLADQGGEFAANVNKMIRNLNFQQVIIERMDRLKPGIHLTLKVASVMGQWVDLDILHKFYPINKSKEELRGHLLELERGNFLKPTDTEGVWEFNMVERDIVYEVIPHYQRRRLHAKLAQELERSLEEHHVATLTTIAYHWNQACMGHEVTEVECALKAIEYWQRAAEAAYSGSSLMEALRLYQKAAQIAEVLGESMGDSFHAAAHGEERSSGMGIDGDGGGNSADRVDRASALGGPGTDRGSAGDGVDPGASSFTAVGSAFRGQLNWSLISRITRAQWEKSMASCCLGIVLQHRYEFNTQMEYWDTEDYFTLLTEHAIRGLMLLGAPHPKTVLSDATDKSPLAALLCCCFAPPDELSGWQVGVVLQDQEVTEIRDILLVLIIAAEHYSLQHDGEEYTRLLTFCKRVCKFFNKCSDTGLDPFVDIRSACSTRIKNFKASRGAAATMDFGLVGPVASALQENGLGGGGAMVRSGAQGMVGPELSRAVLGTRRYQGAPPGPRAPLFA